MRNLFASVCFAFFALALTDARPVAAQTNGVPDCDVCGICGGELYVKLTDTTVHRVTAVTLIECLTTGCLVQDVSKDLQVPIYNGEVHHVLLSSTPPVLHRYIRFKYCADSACKFQSEVKRPLYNCGL